MKKLKIIFHLPSLSLGGVAKNTIKLSKQYVEMGHEVIILVHKLDGLYKNLIPEGVKIYELGITDITKGLPTIHKYLKACNADLVISSRDFYNNYFLLLKKLFGYKFILMITCHTNLSEECRQSKNYKTKLLIKGTMLISRFTYSWADKIVAVSDGVREDVSQFAKIPKGKISTIYNPIIDDKYLEQLQENVDMLEFDKTRDYKIIVSAGRLTEQKNFELLIKSFKIVVEKYEKVILVILGEGKLRDEIESIISTLDLKNRVLLPGYVDNPIKYMKQADVFVMSSDWEGFGNTLAEALATGISVISTDCPSGPAEILDNGRYGRLVSVGNVIEMSDAILDALNEKVDALIIEQRINRGKEFSAESIAIRYLDVVGLNTD